MGGGEEADSADEAYEDDTEPFEELLGDDGDGDDDAASGSQGVRRRKGPPAPVDVEQRSSEEPLASAVFDTPAKRQARSLAADLEGVLEKGVEDRSEKDKAAQESWPAVSEPAARRKSEEEIYASIRAAQPCATSPSPPPPPPPSRLLGRAAPPPAQRSLTHSSRAVT